MVVNNIFFIEQLNDGKEYNLKWGVYKLSEPEPEPDKRISISPSVSETDSGHVNFKFNLFIKWTLKVCFLNEWNKLSKYEPNIHHSNVGSSREFSHHTEHFIVQCIFLHLPKIKDINREIN